MMRSNNGRVLWIKPKETEKEKRKEAYEMCFKSIKDLTYTCKRCKIKASFSMYWFKKNKLKFNPYCR